MVRLLLSYSVSLLLLPLPSNIPHPLPLPLLPLLSSAHASLSFVYLWHLLLACSHASPSPRALVVPEELLEIVADEELAALAPFVGGEEVKGGGGGRGEKERRKAGLCRTTEEHGRLCDSAESPAAAARGDRPMAGSIIFATSQCDVRGGGGGGGDFVESASQPLLALGLLRGRSEMPRQVRRVSLRLAGRGGR
eukprot:760285-Hanusia_phi.AAC.1